MVFTLGLRHTAVVCSSRPLLVQFSQFKHRPLRLGRCRKNLPLSGRGLTKMTDSFWTGGPDAYADGLHEHYKPRMDDLRKRRDDADDTQRAELDAEIERVEAEYKSKLDSIDDCLF